MRLRWFPLFLVSIFVSSLWADSQEWPKWLGPDGEDISTSPIADKWPVGGPPKIWEQKVGLGYSSPIGFEGKVYLFSQNGNLDTLTAFDADSGKVIWSQSYPVTTPADMGQAKNPDSGLPLPLATPTIDKGHIYTYGGGGDLVCRKLEDGSEVWRLNVLRETNEQILPWNESSSPLVGEKLVYVQGGKGGSTAIAVDRETGKIVWESEAKTVGGYAAPIIVDVDGTRQLIVFGGDTLYGMDPQSGKTLWATPRKTAYDINASTPIYHDHHLFVSCGDKRGSMMLTLSAAGAKEDWNQDDKDIQLKFQPAILDRDYLYGNSGGVLKCMHWPDGRIAWEEKLNLAAGGTIVRDGDLLITLSERGKLSLVRATPQGATVLSQIPLFDFGTTWSTPLIYRGKLYAMGRDTLVCLDISPHPTNAARATDARLADAHGASAAFERQ